MSTFSNRDIHLFDTFVAGVTYLEDKHVLQEVRPGDELALRREGSHMDSATILLFAPDGRKVGYVPARDREIFIRLLDAGKTLKVGISKIDRSEEWVKINIGVYLSVQESGA